MARHRRPFSVAPPPELLMFAEEDWPGPEGYVPGSNNLEWDSPFQRWTNARRAYAKEHPGSALAVLDQLRFERSVRRSLYSWS